MTSFSKFQRGAILRLVTKISLTSKYTIMYYESIIKSVIHQLKTKYPYDIRMSKEKYNEWIQDLLYEDITSQLTK